MIFIHTIKGLVVTSICTTLFFTTSLIAIADTDALIKERQENFNLLGDNAKALRGAFGSSSPDWQAISATVSEIQRSSAKILDYFPPESADTFAVTDAKPEIWDDFADFTSKNDALSAKVNTLAKAVDAKDANAAASALRAVGSACKDCHTSYREK